jgi:ABC-type polar amino acid transport system ATPase subunit
MAYKVKLDKIEFCAGPKPNGSSLEVNVPTVTILVGPNNSGKSLALREIENWCWNVNEEKKVIKKIQMPFPSTEEEALSLVKAHKTDPPENQTQALNHIWVGLPTFRQSNQVLHEQINLDAIKGIANNRNEVWLRNGLARLYTIRLDGRTRFTLSDPKPTGDLQAHPRNHLWALFKNDIGRERVRQFTEEAFGLHFVIDPTAMTQFRVRMSKKKPSSKMEEQALDEAARKFHKDSKLISELSDGVQAFTGLVSAVLSFQHSILLIDEPEAFLHPPLARRLGKNLSEIAGERDASLVVATHSSEFLMGCIEATPNLSIVRLNYENNLATARSIPPNELQKLMHDPLLRSVQALRALFHRFVIVTEADKDRAFYEEINYRLNNTEKALDDVLFLNAQNWQTIPRIIKPLRKLGIPAAAIMDIDVIADPKGWIQIYEMLNIEKLTQEGIERLRLKCEKTLLDIPETSDGKKRYKIHGVDCINGREYQEICHLIMILEEYGLFIVDVGELECWLSSLGIPIGPKKTWLTRIFTVMGSDPASSNYVLPTDKDVWKFIMKIKIWMENSKRKGIP